MTRRELDDSRAYLDTSVFGGYFDKEFAPVTRQLWEQIERGNIEVYLSSAVDEELKEAPPEVRDLFHETIRGGLRKGNVFRFEITAEMLTVAKAYLAEGVVPPKSSGDAVHVAGATVWGIPNVVSWNFKHLVNPVREDGFNRVNRRLRYKEIRIVSPKEIILPSEE